MIDTVQFTYPSAFGRLASIARQPLFMAPTPLEAMPNLSRYCGTSRLFVKRDDCTTLAFGGNKVRQLEFYLGDAILQSADTILITSALQSNFVRSAAAAARKCGLECHIQLEERVQSEDPAYRTSGNVLLDKLLGATLHSYPEGEDETGADRKLDEIAADLKAAGHRPYVIYLAPGHAPLGALGYVVAAEELLQQIYEEKLDVAQIFVGSGSGATHAGLLFGLRALGSKLRVVGVCVRRDSARQRTRIHHHCGQIAELLGTDNLVTDDDVELSDSMLAPGYGKQNRKTLQAIILGARMEGLLVDPVYTGKVLASVIEASSRSDSRSGSIFLHSGGTPALFAYQQTLEKALNEAHDGPLSTSSRE